MRATGQRFALNNLQQLEAFTENLKTRWLAGKKTTVQYLEDDRTPEQNTMLWGLITDIVKK